MPNNKIPQYKQEKIRRLDQTGNSICRIAALTDTSRPTVRKYIEKRGN
jgi:hypothetical protein